MSDDDDMRCPLCNGTGLVPSKRAAQIEGERDAHTLVLYKLGQLWGAIAELYGEATKKRKQPETADALRNRIGATYRKGSELTTLDDKMGRRPDA